jgi:hypothetical protein
MNEPITPPAAGSKTKTGKIVRIVLQWTILGLVVFTCIMAAIRKFGG